MAEAVLDLGLGFDHRRGQFECSAQVYRAVGYGENHRLLGAQAEAVAGRIVIDVSVGGLGQAPFADIAFVQAAGARG